MIHGHRWGCWFIHLFALVLCSRVPTRGACLWLLVAGSWIRLRTPSRRNEMVRLFWSGLRHRCSPQGMVNLRFVFRCQMMAHWKNRWKSGRFGFSSSCPRVYPNSSSSLPRLCAGQASVPAAVRGGDRDGYSRQLGSSTSCILLRDVPFHGHSQCS